MTHLSTMVMGSLALTAGIVYALAVHAVLAADPEHPYVFAWVIGGVLLSLAVAAVVVPLGWLAVVLGVFACTGLPQVAGAMWRNGQARRAARSEATRAIRRSLEE